MEQKSTSFWKSAMTYGLYLGIALIIYSVILYVLGQSFNKTLGYVSFVVMIAGIIWAQVSYKKQLGDVLSYGQGVGIATGLMLFAGIIGAIYTYLLYTVIDPELYQQYLLFVEETTTNQLINRGMSDEQISQAVAMGAKFQTPVIMAIGAIVTYVITGVIVGLITSIFIKKNPSEEPVE